MTATERIAKAMVSNRIDEQPFDIIEIKLSPDELRMLRRLLPYKFNSSRENANRVYDSLRSKVFSSVLLADDQLR